MPKYLVFHDKNPSFFLDDDAKVNGAYPVTDLHYNKIAIVQAADLIELFYKTNHVDHNWTENEGVELLPEARELSVRSTSVGDLVLNLETMELLICAPIGWEKADWVA